MATKAVDVKRGIERSAGRKFVGAGTIPGVGNVVTPLRKDAMHGDAGRNERHASHKADQGNEMTGNPSSPEVKY